ncbi:hypothetical protein Q7P35_005835 [Cladosporium inversicolor]
MDVSSASSAIALAPRFGDLEANHPQPEPSSTPTDGNECCWTCLNLKYEWKFNRRQMRHWIAVVVIVAFAIGLAVYYQVGHHD